MAKIAKISESAKAANNSTNVEVANQEVANQEATTQEAKEVDNTPTLNADPQYCWDLMCKVLGADGTTPRSKRGENVIDRQFYGIARATTLALLVGGQDAFVERVNKLDGFDGNKLASEYVSDLLAKGHPRQAVACVVELCILKGVRFSSELFENFYLCTEEVKCRGELIGWKIIEKYDDFGLSEDESKAFVRRLSSEKISDKKLLDYIKDKGVTYDEAVTALSQGGQKMRLDFEALKKLGIYEINYTSNSAVKDYVYFIIK